MSFPLPRKKHLRADAAWVLYQILEEGRSSKEVLAITQARHNPKDSAWLQEMTMGVLRHLPVMQTWLRKLLEKPLKGNKKIIEHLILVGLYQIHFSRVLSHAAVNETVEATSVLNAQALKGLVNAILRNFQRSDLANEALTPLLESGLPKWLFKAIGNAYPNNAHDIIQATNTVAPLWLRVNTQKITLASYLEKLDIANIAYSTSASHPQGVVLAERREVTSLPGYELGLFSVQDGAAQLAALYLGAKLGERVLDCCAAPGGKTGHIMELQPALSACIAMDNDPKRLRRVKENMERLGHTPTVVQGNAASPSDWWDGEKFDRILLDVPCSATGVMRRHPDIRWLRKSSDIAPLVSLQALILREIWQLLKPGGTLVYATCSILPEENSKQVAAFLQEEPTALLSPLTEHDTVDNPGRQITPGEDRMDGFYYARLIKS